MVLLALDTTAGYCSVALLRAGQLLVREADAGQGTAQSTPAHSRLLLPMIDALLAEAGVALADLDAIAFGAGPGSFTGLRIACGVAQGLGLAIDRPLVAVDSLSSIAWASGRSQVVACLDARMGEVYCAAVRIVRGDAHGEGTVQRVSAPRACRPDAVPLPPDGGWSGCGNGFAAYREALAARLPSLVSIDPDVMPGAAAVASLGAIAWRAGEAVDAALAAPYYVRDKVALDAVEQAALRAGSGSAVPSPVGGRPA